MQNDSLTEVKSSDPTDDDSTDAELSERDIRALTEYLTVLADVGPAADADSEFLVVSESGSEYHVNAATGECSCPDYEHREPEGGCKHVRRVQFATGSRAVPPWVEPAALDDQLGAHVDGSPRVALADGGTEILEASDGGEILDADDADADSDLPDSYRREDTPEPRWTHTETGLRVALVKSSQPAGGQMTRSTALQRDTTTWTLSVRPDGPRGYAEVYDQLAGGKQAALEVARDWMQNHPDGELKEGE